MAMLYGRYFGKLDYANRQYKLKYEYLKDFHATYNICFTLTGDTT